MRKLLCLLLAVLLVIVPLAGCDDSAEAQSPSSTAPVGQGTTPTSSSGDSWTVLVYLCGTDLETSGGFASINISEMVAATQSENVTVIFQTGGTESWAYDVVDPGALERWKIGYDSFELVDSRPLANMGDGNTLGEFLQWGVQSYPADRYACILWNHGGGSVAGIAADELYGGDTLDLKELAYGVSMAGQQFEIIGFDACLMSTIETAAALTPYARYMVASQEWEPGTGWDYSTWLSYIAENPTADGLEVGKVICDSFYEKCVVGETESIATLAVTDLSRIPALVLAFDQMAAEMKGFTNSPEKLQPLTQAMMRAESYGGNNDNEGYTNMVDLGDFTLGAEGVLSQTGEALLDELFAAVPYRIAGSARQRSNGLSVYVPLLAIEEEMDAYAQLAAVSGEYLRFLEGIFDWQVPPGVVIHQLSAPAQEHQPPETTEIAVDGLTLAQALRQEEYPVRFSLDLTEDGYILLTMDEGAEVVSTVAFDLFYEDEDTNSLWYLGSDYDVNSSDDGTQYWDNFQNVWTIINDNLCMMVALSFTSDYILYTVPVTVNGNETNLRMIYHIATNEYEVIGTWDGIDTDTGMSSRDVRKLQDGDEVCFVFAAAELDTGEAYSFNGGSFIVNGPVVAEVATLFDGSYYYQYVITDIFGNTYESEMAKMTSESGEIVVELV